MAFGILESSPARGLPPGTVLFENFHAGSQHAEQVFIPQPSNSPRDPLNMSKMRKELYFITLIFGACVTGVVGPLLVPGFSIVAAAFDVGLTSVTLLNGSLIMALGLSAYLCAPLAAVYGRRIVYLITSLVMIFGCVWASYAHSYGSLLGSRVLQGLGMGAFFSLAGTASINDVFFVHQRGRRAGLWNFAVIVSVNVAPVISGYIITGLSWQWSFRILAVAFAVAFALVLFFVPETLYEREISHEGIESLKYVQSDHLQTELSPNGTEKRSAPQTTIPDPSMISTDAQVNASSPAWKTMFGLRNIHFESPTILMPKLVTPLLLLRHPVVLWACIMWSVTFSWTIIQGAVADQIYEAPPYNLDATAVGILIGVPPLIGSALGTVAGGWLCDMAAQMMAIRNSGVYEPEFRLVVLIPGLITTGMGSFGLGIAVDGGSTIWASAIFLGFLNFGVGVSCTGIIAYTNDVCHKKAAEAFGVAMLVKSAFAFGLTFMLNDYYVAHGAKIFFITWATLTTGVTLLSVPMYIFGKRVRSYIEL